MTCICKDGQLRVILSKAEMEKYNIDYEIFENGSKKADKALVSILKLASYKARFNTDAVKFFIEIFPNLSGGCEIFFTPDKFSKKRISAVVKRSNVHSQMFEFCDCDDMLSAIELLYESGIHNYIKSSLFENLGKYRLFLFGDDINLSTVLLEFTSKQNTSNIAKAKTCEYWNPISLDNAINLIGKAFYGKRKL